MKVQNLRIGNYVKVDGLISEIIAIAKNDVDYINVKNINNKVITLPLTDESIESIPLDKELLTECCGFDTENRISAGDMYLRFTPKYNNYIVLENKSHEELIHFWNVKTLHRLQNLYFSLAGAELSIALNCLSKVLG